MKWRKHRISLADFMRGNYPPYVPYPCWTKASPATDVRLIQATRDANVIAGKRRKNSYER